MEIRKHPKLIIIGTILFIVIITFYVNALKETSQENSSVKINEVVTKTSNKNIANNTDNSIGGIFGGILRNTTNSIDGSIPRFLIKSFPNTDWSKIDPSILKALSGGPGKDGIPAIDTPKFDALSSVKSPDTVQAIVMKSENTVKVYPYNILVWHEIVNDTVDGVPVSITFCPLCGSAIVYNRTLPDGVTTFGVSGALAESNMIMYDRATETLWQQSNKNCF